MHDKLNKCLILLTLDGSALKQHKDRVEQIFKGVNAEEIIDLLMGNDHNTEINAKAIRTSIPIMISNLKKLYRNVSDEKINQLYQHWNLNVASPMPNDYECISKALYDAGIEHIYLKSLSFYQKAYLQSFAERRPKNINVLVGDNAIDAAYAHLINSFGFSPIQEEHGARSFIKQYSPNYIPLIKNQISCTLNHKLCSPRMVFCKINAHIQEVFSRAVVDQSMGFAAKILSPEDQILFCFAQMYYQQMYENRYTPQHYADIVGYIYSNGVDWEKVINYSNRYDANRILFYCILFLTEVHQYLFDEDLFDQSLLESIPAGMIRHLYECRNGALFTDDVVGYRDSKPHELLLGFRHTTASYEDLTSYYHSMKKEEKITLLDKIHVYGIHNYNYDTYGDISKRRDEV